MSTMNASASPAEAASPSLCPLCCEVNLSASSAESVVLSTCRHRSCRACLAKWIEREESSGQTTPPGCPFCRSVINEEDVLLILGRPFQPREIFSSDTNHEGEIDELTLQWINEHTVPCKGCGSLIEKADGCDKIECLCGYRFCYKCGTPGGTCGCNPGHGFLNDDEYVADAPLRDSSGRVDLRSCILRRKVRWEREERRDEREEEELERWCHSEENANVCTINGRWLYSPRKRAGSVFMLAHQLHRERIRRERERARPRLGSNPNADNVASWLFLPRGADVHALRQLQARDNKKHARFEKGCILEKETSDFDSERDLNLVWLFLPDQTGLDILGGMKDAMTKRGTRIRAKWLELEEDNTPEIVMFIRNGAWLFQKSTGTQDHLVRLCRHWDNYREKRRRAFWNNLLRRDKEDEDEKQCLGSIVLLFPCQEEES